MDEAKFSTAVRKFDEETDKILAFARAGHPGDAFADPNNYWRHDMAIIKQYIAFQKFMFDCLVCVIKNDPGGLAQDTGHDVPKHMSVEECKDLIRGERYFDFSGRLGLLKNIAKFVSEAHWLHATVADKKHEKALDLLVALRNHAAHDSEISKEHALKATGAEELDESCDWLREAGNFDVICKNLKEMAQSIQEKAGEGAERKPAEAEDARAKARFDQENLSKESKDSTKGAGILNVRNRTIFTCDCLDVMRGMADGCIDLIYLDPPHNSNANYAAPIGSVAAGAAFKDTWGLGDVDVAWWGEIEEAYPSLYKLLATVRDVHSESMMAYLIYMGIRIIEMRRILKESGSIYLHCDPIASHYLKLVMDAIFGRQGFRNEIAWCRAGGQARDPKYFPRKHDILLFYSGKDGTFNPDSIRIPPKWDELGGHRKDEVARKYRGKVPEDWWHTTFGMNPEEWLGYPIQKPLALLQRVIKASSNPGDIVLDPFCGSATTCVAAEIESRKWVGIDVSSKAFELITTRLEETSPAVARQIIHRTDIPDRL